MTSAVKNIRVPRAFKIGHFQDDFTGVTVLLCEKGAVGGYDCRGGAPGTRETDLLRPEKMMNEVHAVALCGGSAFGLAAMDGVMRYLMEQGVGFKTAGKRVPIVTGAVIFDLNHKEIHHPTAEFGFNACKNADKAPSFGNIGVGRGATVGKIRGLKHACKGGVGASTVKACGVNVTAVVAVNAMGDVVDERGEIIAGAKGKDGFINTEKVLIEGDVTKLLFGGNTTIGCILTDAALDKVQANKLASAAHNGIARAIRPSHTDYDGDTMFCLASGSKPVIDLAILQSAAALATERAIRNAVDLSSSYEVSFDDEE